MFNDSYIEVTPPSKIKEGQELKKPQGISSPLRKDRAHNLKVACSNQAPATKSFKGLGDFQNVSNPFFKLFSNGFLTELIISKVFSLYL